MKSRFVGTLAVALTSLGIFAGTAGASNAGDHGQSGINSINSIVNSGGLGTCQAATTPAGYRSESYTSNAQGYPGWFYCGVQG